MIHVSAGSILRPTFPNVRPMWMPRSGWDGTLAGTGTFGLRLAENYMKYMDLSPPPGDSWDYRSFDFDKDPARTSKFAAEFNATNPDLQPLYKRGGKIIHYHGWADSLVTALMSVDYFESVLRKMGAKQTGEFYRLFLIPGMFHCRGGVGCDTVDWITPIVDWVEKGAAPAKLIGARVTDGQTERTRPLCPYPAVAKYKGKGSIDAAENFICRNPSQVQ